MISLGRSEGALENIIAAVVLLVVGDKLGYSCRVLCGLVTPASAQPPNKPIHSRLASVASMRKPHACAPETPANADIEPTNLEGGTPRLLN